jgi:hypothetical protein
MKAFEIYGSPQFKALVEESGLTGLKFTRIFPITEPRYEDMA